MAKTISEHAVSAAGATVKSAGSAVRGAHTAIGVGEAVEDKQGEASSDLIQGTVRHWRRIRVKASDYA
jgi:hypothetical protein